jgi:hypothetical protein
MARRRTLSELFWPETPESRNLALEWAATAAFQVLDLTWRGFEHFRDTRLHSFNFYQTPEQMERDLVRIHQIEITVLWAQETGGYSSLVPVHEYPELESRSSAGAKPPSIDLGFAHRENRRWHWPIEAKVVARPSQLTLYITDVEKFKAGTAAPLVGQGGLIAYLLDGSEDDLFSELQTRLGTSLSVVTGFSSRPHRASIHTRRPFPELQLHHLVMACRAPSRTSC